MPAQISKTWIRICFFGFLLLCGAFFFQLYKLQIKNHQNFSDLSNKQYFSPYKENKNRGAIVFTYKDGEEFFAAVNKTGYNLEINPTIIKNPEDTFNILSSIIEIDEEKYFQSASKKNDNSEIIYKRLDSETAEQIKKLGLQGVILTRDDWRFYPGRELAAQTIGFQSYKDNEIKGRYGLENFYDEILDEKDSKVYRNFFVEIFSDVKDTISGDGEMGTIVTTIEPNVQTFLEEQIDEIQNNWSADKTGGIIMDPKSGRILSIATSPGFDVNIFNEQKDISVFSNHAVSDVYEMGSVIKPLTMAIGLDTGSITPASTYEDKGEIVLNGEKILNHDKKAHGIVDMQTIISKSLNTGVAYVVSKVGNEKFADYMKKLLAKKTGIDLPNESKSIISNLDSTRDVEYATASFGQGIAMSPMQTITALASLANGGYLIKPHIAKEIRFDLGRIKNLEEGMELENQSKIFSSESTEEVTKMLIKAFDEALLGGNLSMSQYSIASKTGTAQMADNQNGGYFEDKFLHSFFGYFPAYDPEFIIFLYTIDPRGANYSSDTLAVPFQSIVKYLINYYQIEPDR